jgi:hypothetical protein
MAGNERLQYEETKKYKKDCIKDTAHCLYTIKRYTATYPIGRELRYFQQITRADGDTELWDIRFVQMQGSAFGTFIQLRINGQITNFPYTTWDSRKEFAIFIERECDKV